MTYLFDNNISYRYANMLKALDVDVVALRDVFSHDIKDADLLRALTGSDYVLVSGDRSMRTGAIEAPLLRAAKITSLFFAPFWDRKQQWDQATWLIRRWQLIHGFAQGATRGTCAIVKENGRSQLFSL